MFTGLSDGTLDAVLEIWPSGVTVEEQEFFDSGQVQNLGELGAVGRTTAETGDRGRFLGTDPSYSEFDGQIIENLGLPFDVQFSGSEPATVAELDSRVAAEEPVLMYWWEPTAAVSRYDLVQVELPPFNEACGASQASGDGGVDCAYPEDPIFKAVSPDLATKAPAVYAFLDNFTLSNADQLSMLPAMELDGEDPADVAQKWVDENTDTWKAWLDS